MQRRWTMQEAYTPSLTPSVLRLILFFVTAYIVQKLAEVIFSAPTTALALNFGPGFHPAQILTHIFLNPIPGLSGALHILFQCLILWGFGSELERLWGSSAFLRFFYIGLLGGVVAGASVALFPALRGVYHAGFGAGLAAVMIAYAMIWPDRKVLFFFVISMKMKWLILILFILMTLGNVTDLITFSGGALAGTLFIFYYARRGLLGSGYTIQEKSGTGKSWLERYRDKKKKKRLEEKQKEIDRRIDMKAEVDRLLEKISKEGINSLSRKERTFLDRASKEF